MHKFTIDYQNLQIRDPKYRRQLKNLMVEAPAFLTSSAVNHEEQMHRDSRLCGRLVAFLHKRLNQIDFQRVSDPRGHQGRRWPLSVLLKSVIIGMVSGQKSLSDLEDTTASLSNFARRLFGIRRRVPDTTVRDVLVSLDANELRSLIHRQIKEAVRRKSIPHSGFPCGIVAMDGKWVATNKSDEQLTQSRKTENGSSCELLRTVTSCLVSCQAKVCIDARPLSPRSNEVAGFKESVRDLLNTYGRNLFEVITYDAGGCSESNGRFIDDEELGYLFGLKSENKYLLQSARYLLENLTWKQAIAETRDYIAGKVVIRQLWMTDEMRGDCEWPHLKQVLRVRSQVVDPKTQSLKHVEDRYFVSNIHQGRFTNEQWLELVRRHWNVENNCHNVWDRIYREDDRVWIREPNGMLAVQMLRRLSYNLLALFRSVTQRTKEKREIPWKTLMREIYKALLLIVESSLLSGSRIQRAHASVPSG